MSDRNQTTPFRWKVDTATIGSPSEKGKSVMPEPQIADAGDFYSAAIHRAEKWREQHSEHVRNLEAQALNAVPPAGMDVIRPELWKGIHWRWLRECVNV